MRLPKSYLLVQVRKGHLPFLKVGKQYRFDEAQVRDALARMATSQGVQDHE